MKRLLRQPARSSQQGAATLIVVMVLFFIISLVAAYTNRSLIFEQRTSSNQYRSTQALEVADAGLEWALSQLNFERLEIVNNRCLKNTDTSITPPSFRERYLIVDPATGKISPRPNPAGGQLTPSCVWTSAGWSCSCPTTGPPTLTAPAAPGVWPAFRVRFRPIMGEFVLPLVPKQPGTVWIDVVGCTRLDAVGAADPCLNFDGLGTLNEGRAVASSVVTQAGNAAGPPPAALTVFGSVTATGALGVYNTRPGGSGLTVHASGVVSPGSIVFGGLAGTPPSASWSDGDAQLSPAAVTPFSAAERMFATVFKLRPEIFRTQQGIIEMPCTAGCTAAAVRAELAAKPGRPLWLNGTLSVDSAGDIGSAADPVLMVLNGNLEFTGAGLGARIFGLVYTRLPVPNPGALPGWVTSGAGGQVIGAVLSEGGVSGAGAPSIVYDGDVLNRLRYAVGTFVRVPGSWRDFQ